MAEEGLRRLGFTERTIQDVKDGITECGPEMRSRGDTGLNDILAVGYSTSASEWQAWRVTFGVDDKPVLRRQARASLQPCTPEMSHDLKASGLTIDFVLSDASQAVQRAAPIMEIQRRHAAPHGCAIGGFQEATALGLGVTLSTVVNFWPDDRIGARVQLA